jgi:hypothetical protein
MRVSFSPTIGYGASSAVLGLSTAHTQGGGGALDYFFAFLLVGAEPYTRTGAAQLALWWREALSLSLSLSLVVMIR